MAEISQATTTDGSETRFLNSLIGSARSCTNISRELVSLGKATAVCLSVPLEQLAKQLKSLQMIFDNLCKNHKAQTPPWSPDVNYHSIRTQRQCQEIVKRLSIIVAKYGPWDIVASNCDLIDVCALSVRLHEQESELNLLTFVFCLAEDAAAKPSSECEPPDSIVLPPRYGTSNHYNEAAEIAYGAALDRLNIARRAKERMDEWCRNFEGWFTIIRKVLQAKRAVGGLCDPSLRHRIHQDGSMSTSDADNVLDTLDCSTIESTTGALTPNGNQSDVGGDTTEPSDAPAITRWGLRQCKNQISRFQNAIDQVIYISQLDRADHMPVEPESARVVLQLYDTFVVTLRRHLGVPISAQERLPVSISPDVAHKDIDPQEALDKIITSMEATPTDRDIMKLVFHWTTLDECNGFKRADVMNLDNVSGSQMHV